MYVNILKNTNLYNNKKRPAANRRGKENRFKAVTLKRDKKLCKNKTNIIGKHI